MDLNSGGTLLIESSGQRLKVETVGGTEIERGQEVVASGFGWTEADGSTVFIQAEVRLRSELPNEKFGMMPILRTVQSVRGLS